MLYRCQLTTTANLLKADFVLIEQGALQMGMYQDTICGIVWEIHQNYGLVVTSKSGNI